MFRNFIEGTSTSPFPSVTSCPQPIVGVRLPKRAPAKDAPPPTYLIWMGEQRNTWRNFQP